MLSCHKRPVYDVSLSRRPPKRPPNFTSAYERVPGIDVLMNSSYGSFDFAGGWQDDLFSETANYLEGPFPNATIGRTDAAGNYQEVSTASTPEEWLRAHSQWSQQSNAYLDSSAAFDFSNSQAISTYSTSQGYAYEHELAELSDFDQCQSHSSFSEPDFGHLSATQYGGNDGHAAKFTPLSLASPTSGHFSHSPAHPRSVQTNATSSAAFDNSYNFRPNPTAHQAYPIHVPSTQGLSPNDPLYPRQQSTRSKDDLYTPTYVRGDGATRAGWCTRCCSWLTLKDSAYWYHMHFAHGITATGRPLPRPIHMRASAGAARGVGDKEALCGDCGRWVLMVAGEKGFTAWWRHAYRCKLKDGATGREGRRRGKSASPRKVVARPAIPRS